MIRERVNRVVSDWCGIAPANQGISLDVLWSETRNNPARPHSGIEFQQAAVDNLLSKLQDEFRRPGIERKDISVLTHSSFKPGGAIDSVNNLVDAVVGCPNLPPTPGGEL
jgi:hypothetical protein